MTKKPWVVPDPPVDGDATNDITFRAVGAALSQWEWFEGNLSLIFSYLVAGEHENLAASRSYGAVEVFRGRKTLIETAAEVYFKYTKDKPLEDKLGDLLKQANEFSGRRNEIAHGIVNPYSENKDGVLKSRGWALYPAYYATKKRKLPADLPLKEITLTYVYSSAETDNFGRQFSKLAHTAIEILTRLAEHAQVRRASDR